MSTAEESSWSYRIRGLLVLAGEVGLLGLAVWLDPDRLERTDSGYSFLKPCGFLHSTGYPCPTCFMTRSFVYMMHARVIKAFQSQLFGAFLCLLVIYLGIGAVRVLITGRPWRPVWYGWPKKYVFGGLAAGFLGAWIFKLVHGTFVTGEFPLR